jgi:hypothetical protein
MIADAADPTPAADPRLADLIEALDILFGEMPIVTITGLLTREEAARDLLTLLPARTATTEAVALIESVHRYLWGNGNRQHLVDAYWKAHRTVRTATTEAVALIEQQRDALIADWNREHPRRLDAEARLAECEAATTEAVAR